ncbi:leucine-rich repeat domain-containing protein [Blastopirellula marina]|uniref:Leucine Rich repeats (2 copies) n=1 Tax=Blastopirellula marina TaxID=124 RepID=A0A2S8GPC1_9BACT|nr:leucine-rich repeat domain-containing protein [Blastopirellula marina]PQO46272.1 hypothetical protein C5Y93_09810 [Blastopirellula marina]
MPTAAKSNQPTKRRWLRFSIRGMMLATLALAIFLAMIGKPIYLSMREQPVVEEIAKVGGTIHYDYELEGESYDPGKTPPGSAWLKQLLGELVFARVRAVELPRNPELVAQLSAFTGLRRLRIEEITLTEDQFDALVTLPRLERLEIDGGKWTPEQLTRLAQTHQVTYLVLQGAGAGDKHLQQLVRFPFLKELYLENSPANDASLKPIGSLTQLESLGLLGCPNVTDEGISSLAGLTHLRSLVIDAPQMTAESLPVVRDMTKLEWLRIEKHPPQYARLADAEMQSLAGLTRLKFLSVGGFPIGDEGLQTIGTLTQLEELALRGTRISYFGLAHIRELKKLRDLDMDDFYLRDSDNETLDNLPVLNSLTTNDIQTGKRTRIGWSRRTRP